MDDQQVALDVRGQVEGTHASFIAFLVVHNFKQQVCPKVLHLGGSRGPHGRSGSLVRGPPGSLYQTRISRRLAARVNLPKSLTRPALGQFFKISKSFIIINEIFVINNLTFRV
ncbi:hypothetical protein HanRHA438_Chr08g0365261 [Helianthus annuus]|nr:hypothetical protein HanRHA438_Chr08g0365261 [Helianthus annuus]